MIKTDKEIMQLILRDLSPTHFAIYTAILGFKDGECCVTYPQLCEFVSMSKRTVTKCVKQLVNEGFLEIKRIKRCNHYYFPLESEDLTRVDILGLKDGDRIYIDYLDEKEFDLDYCKTVGENVVVSNWLIDNDGNETHIETLLKWVDKGMVKVYTRV